MKIKEKLYPYKQYLVFLFKYPKLQWRNADYDAYWNSRKLTSETPLNSFQQKRADLVLKYMDSSSSVFDMGGGNGRILIYLNIKKQLKRMIVGDISRDALEMAKSNGLEGVELDISKIGSLENMPLVDYILMFEILEHVANSEEVLDRALNVAKKGVFFSVPNTGFIFHRLRLLFGRFPLQWRLRPSEHVRFWTVRDMRWWLGEQGINNYKLHLYEGIGLLNLIWPSLFGQGIFIYIPISGLKMPNNQGYKE